MFFVFGARSVSVIVVLVMSAIHPAAGAISQPAQAQQIMHRLERDLATNNYNDIYTLSIASLDISRAAYLSRVPHSALSKGTVITIRETGPWAMTTMGNNIARLTQPIKIGVRLPDHKPRSWGSEITLDYLQKQQHWYFEG